VGSPHALLGPRHPRHSHALGLLFLAFRWVLLISWVLGILPTHLHSHILGFLFLAIRGVLLMLSWVLGILATHLHSHVLGPLFLAFR
jgi:hypothetical protein